MRQPRELELPSRTLLEYETYLEVQLLFCRIRRQCHESVVSILQIAFRNPQWILRVTLIVSMDKALNAYNV